MALIWTIWDCARRHQEEALALRRDRRPVGVVANSLNNLANVTRRLRDFDASQAMYAESLRINRQLGDCWALGHLLEDMGVLLRRWTCRCGRSVWWAQRHGPRTSALAHGRGGEARPGAQAGHRPA
ncbi:MAG: tetratricopeptide repeat protein [Caldilineaceae bacterium]